MNLDSLKIRLKIENDFCCGDCDFLARTIFHGLTNCPVS